MTGKNTGIRPFAVGNGRRSVGGHDVRVKIHQAFTGDGGRERTHPVRSMAGGTGKALIRYVNLVSAYHARETEAAEVHDGRQVMTFGTKGVRTTIRSTAAQIGIRKEIQNGCSRSGTDRNLAELVPAFQDMVPLRPMGAIGANTAEFAVIVAVVAIGAEEAEPGAQLAGAVSRAVEIQHVGPEAVLRPRTGGDVKHRMARGRRWRQLGNDIEGVRRADRSQRKIPVNLQSLLAGARTVAPQAVLVLIRGGFENGDAIGGANAFRSRL